MEFEEFIEHFNVAHVGKDTVQAHCPTRKDVHASLTISKGHDGKIIMKDWGGDNNADILAAVGLTYSDMFSDQDKKAYSSRPKNLQTFTEYAKLCKCQLVDYYDYYNLTGYCFTRLRMLEVGGNKTFRYVLSADPGDMYIKDFHIEGGREQYNALFPGIKLLDEARNAGEPVYIVEGEKDVKTAQKCGLNAVTFGSATDWNEPMAMYFKDLNAIIIPDNDKPGMECMQEVAKDIKDIAKSVQVVKWPADFQENGDFTDFIKHHKDATEGMEAFRALPRITASEYLNEPQTVNIRPLSDYVDIFRNDMQNHRNNIRTGFKELDIALHGGFTTEMYVLGADTSTGKSAISYTLALNIARQGIDVLYYALEMSRNEFIARGISQESASQNMYGGSGNMVKYGDILNEQYNVSTEQFTKLDYSAYSSYADSFYHMYGNNLHVIEPGTDGITAKRIAEDVKQYKADHNGKVVAIFVDYLQLLEADQSDRVQRDTMTVISKACRVLKSLASQEGAIVFAISSIANDKKSKSIDNNSFKGTGDIGYTSGVALGWNWKGVTDEKDADTARERAQEDKRNGYRQMELVLTKNRNGERDHSIDLRYYPAYNYIVPESHASYNASKYYWKEIEEQNASMQK